MLNENELGQLKELLEETLDKRLSQSENLILEEVSRTHHVLSDKIDRVQKNLDELNQYYRITKLENDNTTLLLQIVNELSKRVEELERKSA